MKITTVSPGSMILQKDPTTGAAKEFPSTTLNPERAPSHLDELAVVEEQNRIFSFVAPNLMAPAICENVVVVPTPTPSASIGQTPTPTSSPAISATPSPSSPGSGGSMPTPNIYTQ